MLDVSVIIYFPNEASMKELIGSRIVRRRVSSNHYRCDSTGTLPLPNSDAPAIILTNNPSDVATYAGNNKILVINASGTASSMAIATLIEITKHKASDLFPQANENTGLIGAEAGDNNTNPLKSLAVETYLRTLFGESLDWSVTDILGGLYNAIINPTLSAGATLPFVFLNNDGAKFILGNMEPLIIWSTVASAVANISINLRSISQLPELLLVHFPNVVKKVLYELRKHGVSCESAAVLAKFSLLTAMFLAINIFSVYAGITLANQSTDKFSEKFPHVSKTWLGIITFTQIIGVFATVLRATGNKFVEWNLTDVKEISETLRELLFAEMNERLSRDAKLDETKIAKLVKGNLENRTTRIYGVSYLYERCRGRNPYENEASAVQWRDILCTTVQWGSYALLAAVALYSTAYSVIAAQAIRGSLDLSEVVRWRDFYASFIALMNFASKAMFLGKATLGISDTIKKMVADDIIKTNADLSRTLQGIVTSVLFTGMGWNTWFSATDIVREHFWSNVAFDVCVGIGATWAINFLDTLNITMMVLQKLKEFYHYCSGTTPVENFDELILAQIKEIASLSNRDFAAKYTKRYCRTISDEEIANIQAGAQELARQYGVVPNDDFNNLMTSIARIQEAVDEAGLATIRDQLPLKSKFKHGAFFTGAESRAAAEKRLGRAKATGGFSSGESSGSGDEDEYLPTVSPSRSRCTIL